MPILILLIYLSTFFVGDHNIHLTYSKVLLEERNITVRTSFFLDDFDLMLSEHHQTSFTNLPHNGKSDSLLQSYLTKRFVVVADGDTLQGQILSSGIEADMCFYIYSYSTLTPIKEIKYSNSLLFSIYPDQKNMISVQHLDTEKTWSFYCIVDDYTYTMNLE